jgi:serine/threonine protein kinase
MYIELQGGSCDMIRIRLAREEWEYDPDSPLGSPGGFGAVFAGRGKEQGPVAVKRLHFRPNAPIHRELRIADELIGRSLERVVPILDSGKDAEIGSFFVVMARAEKSLQQEIDRGVFANKEAVRTLLDIAYGLAEVPEIVHRDLKPANVLYHQGRWKVADFGIARFVEESTSLETLKGFLSAPYAAPEQWLLERATSATDIYALGCVAYALLTGKPPFRGPRREDFRDQHLHKDPPPFREGHLRLRTLLAMMLRKMPKARPGLDRVINLLRDIAAAQESEKLQGSGFDALAQAGAADAEAALLADAAQMEYEDKQRARRKLADSALQTLRKVIDVLFERVVTVAPTASRFDNQFGMPRLVEFGTASIKIGLVTGGRPIPEGVFQRSGWDVVVGATICVTQSKPKPYEWGASLWYTNLGRDEEYRWWEIPYMTTPLLRRDVRYQPFAVSDLSEADKAAAPGMHTIALAAEPRPVDDEDIDDFCDRWADLLAKAHSGQLRHPRHLPLT